MKFIRFAALALSLTLLTGCSILPFRTPEEQREALQAAEARKEEARSTVDPAAALEGDYLLNRTLTNSAGVTLATYQAIYPRFSETGLKAQSFDRINSYYYGELSGLTQDAESFFQRVQAHYGEEWDTVTEPTGVFSIAINYQLLEAPKGYLCVRTDISVSENGQQQNYPRTQVFLLDNGWKLSLRTLLGDDYDETAPLLLDGILEWCGENGIQVTGVQDRTLEEFEDNFALTPDGFLFYVEPFTLNNKNANRYTIPVTVKNYARIIGN